MLRPSPVCVDINVQLRWNLEMVSRRRAARLVQVCFVIQHHAIVETRQVPSRMIDARVLLQVHLDYLLRA